MPRNSLAPLLLLGLTIAASLYLVRGGAARGQDGPDNQQGIFRVPAKEHRRQERAPVVARAALEAPLPSLGAGQVLQVVGGDRHGLTRAICRALAEDLTLRGHIIVLEPQALPGKEAEPVPLPCDGSLVISTSGEIPTAPGAAFAAVVTVTAQPVRLPHDHPALRLFPRDHHTAPAPVTTRVALHVDPLPDAAWPAWWAGVGHAVATELATAIRLPAQADAAAHTRASAWYAAPVATDPAAGPAKPVTEHGRLPSPPQHDVASGLIPFQHPLVRGWVGRLNPVPLKTRQGGTRPAEDALLERLQRGAWAEGPSTPGRRLFSKEDEGLVKSLSLDADGTLVIWQERPSPAAVVARWLAEPASAFQLERHRGIPGLPAGLIP